LPSIVGEGCQRRKQLNPCYIIPVGKADHSHVACYMLLKQQGVQH